MAALSFPGKVIGAGNSFARPLSHYITGNYCEDLGDIGRAIREYQQAIKDDPGSSLLHLSLASAFIKNNDPFSAIAQLNQAAGLDPEAVEPHAILALVYAGQNKQELAAQEYEFALKNASKLEPENVEIYRNLGLIYLQRGKLTQAQGIFKLVTGMAPLDAEARFYLGDIYYESKDYASAERELKSALKLKPDYPEALNFLGYFYLEQNRDIDKAGAMIRKALSFDPENGAYIDSLGWFYFKKGKFKAALQEIEKAASLLSNPEIYDHLGDVSLKLGNRDNARLNWAKSLKLDASQEKVKEKLLKLPHGK